MQATHLPSSCRSSVPLTSLPPPTIGVPQTDGGYLGSDFEAFFSAVVSGAAGVYVGVLLQDAGIETDLVVRPGQRVSVSGDASLPRPPRWGGGGFTVQQRGSLTLQSVAVRSGLSVTNGGSAVLMACGGQLTSLTVTDSSFAASTTTLGGSISLSNAGSVTLEDTTFAEGTELSVGGGTSLSLLSCGGQLTSLTVTDSSFAASTTTLGGSVSLSNAGSVTLEDTTFAEGTELTVGGGTSLSLLSCGGQLTSLTVTDSSFSASTTTLGGAILLSNAGSVTLEDTTFAEGTELTVGGGTSLSLLSCGGQLTSLSVTDSSFSMDDASTTTLGGGSVSLSNAGSVTLEDRTFAEGTELTVGGGTTLSLTAVTLGDSTFLRVSGGSLSLAQMAVTSAQFSAFFLAFAPGSVVRLSEVTVPGRAEALTASLSVGADGVAVYDPPEFLEPSGLVRFAITVAPAARLAGPRRCAGFSPGTRPRALLRRCTPTATRSADAAMRSTAGCSTGSLRTAPAATAARAVGPRGQGGATRRSATARRPTSWRGAAPCCSGTCTATAALGGGWAPAPASGTAAPTATPATTSATPSAESRARTRNLQLCRRMRRATGGASPVGTTAMIIKEPSTSWRGTAAAAAGGARAHHRAAARCGGCCWSGERSS
eukprot:COSAG02_NODE_549_length_20461_cov_11.385866_9_plen_653_part_00